MDSASRRGDRGPSCLRTAAPGEGAGSDRKGVVSVGLQDPCRTQVDGQLRLQLVSSAPRHVCRADGMEQVPPRGHADHPETARELGHRPGCFHADCPTRARRPCLCHGSTTGSERAASLQLGQQAVPCDRASTLWRMRLQPELAEERRTRLRLLRMYDRQEASRLSAYGLLSDGSGGRESPRYRVQARPHQEDP